MMTDPGPPSPPSLGEYLTRFDIPNPKPSCLPSLQYWPVSSFPAKQLTAGQQLLPEGKDQGRPFNTWVGSRRLIHIFKRRPTCYTCGLPRWCILVTLILVVFRMMMVVVVTIMMSIFTILIMRSGLVPIFKRRLEGYGRSECASKLCQEDGIPTRQQPAG